MKGKIKKTGGVLVVACCALVLGSQAFFADGSAAYAQGTTAQSDNNIHAEVLKALKKSEYKNVQVTVHGGLVDLSGSVKDFATKEEADRRVHRIKDVVAVRNTIQISSAGQVSDAQIQKKLVNEVKYDRVGFGQAFNAIDVNVQNGVVTLSGNALDPVAADDAVNLASRAPGVLDVIDNIQVDPLSPMDNRTRMEVYRAVYGYPTLSGYSTDPAKPIRITVVNGHVTLSGVVERKMDKDVAGIRANGVPGVFSVTNNLQVAGSESEKK